MKSCFEKLKFGDEIQRHPGYDSFVFWKFGGFDNRDILLIKLHDFILLQKASSNIKYWSDYAYCYNIRSRDELAVLGATKIIKGKYSSK